jgi:hypothetical protein
MFNCPNSINHIIELSEHLDPWYLVSRRQTYCTGHSSGMGLSVFSARDGPVRERVDDGSVGAIDISRFRYSGLSG